MDLAELLEFTAKEYLDDRVDLVDGDPDSLWSDTTLVRYFNEAQRQLCRRAWCIIDEDHPVAGRITLATDKATYALHKSVLRVLWAKPTDQENPLTRHPESDLMAAVPVTEELYDLNSTTAETGRPLGFSTDAGTRMLRVFRTPSSTENGLVLTLKVVRLPVEWLTLENTGAEPEVPEDYHFLLAMYAAGRALTQPLVDAQQKADGRALLAEFNAEVMEARRDRQRADVDPGRWGFTCSTSVL